MIYIVDKLLNNADPTLQCWGRILGRNRDKSLKNFLLAIHSHLYQRVLIPPMSKSGLKLVCNVNVVYNRKLNSENSQDYAQKPQRNCASMNSAFGTAEKNKPLEIVQVQYCSEIIRMMLFMYLNPNLRTLTGRWSKTGFSTMTHC